MGGWVQALGWVLASAGALPPGYFPKGLAPIDAGGDSSAAALSAKACAGCHLDIAAEWATSRHARAWTNGIFQREYSGHPLAWCVNCHAPLTIQQQAVYGTHLPGDGSLADEGVTCAVCHLRGGVIHAKKRRPGSPHATREVDDFGSPRFCGGCHQFNFPIIERDAAGREVVRRYSEHPMQSTLAQFEAGPYADAPQGCRTCHAADAAYHAYRGAHDPTMLRRALDLEVCRADGTNLAVQLTNVGAGHNVPTGDLHRHLVVRLWKASAPERLYEIFIGRRFEPDPAGGKKTIWDSTLPAGASRRFSLALAALGGAAAEPLSVELRYVYVSDEFPAPRRGPSEPTFVSVEQRRVAVEELPMCDTTQARRE